MRNSWGTRGFLKNKTKASQVQFKNPPIKAKRSLNYSKDERTYKIRILETGRVITLESGLDWVLKHARVLEFEVAAAEVGVVEAREEERCE